MSDAVRQITAGDCTIGAERLALIAGPCLVEDEETTYEIAARLRDITTELGVPFIFKAS